MLLVGCCHFIANMHIYCAPFYLLSWPVIGITTSLRVVLICLVPHIGITVGDRFFPLVFADGCGFVVLLKSYMSANRFVALCFRRFPLVLVILYCLNYFCYTSAHGGPPWTILYVLLVKVLVSSCISPIYSFCLVRASSVLAGAMLIVYLWFLTVIDMLPSTLFHDSLVAISCNACFRHGSSSVCTFDDP